MSGGFTHQYTALGQLLLVGHALGAGEGNRPDQRGLGHDGVAGDQDGVAAVGIGGIDRVGQHPDGVLSAVGGGGVDGVVLAIAGIAAEYRSEEHTSELQSLMRISYAVFCLKKKKNQKE